MSDEGDLTWLRAGSECSVFYLVDTGRAATEPAGRWMWVVYADPGTRDECVGFSSKPFRLDAIREANRVAIVAERAARA